MASVINRLSAAMVAKALPAGMYNDGGGLYLQVAKGGTKSWIFRFMLAGRAREMGLGSIHDFSLREARERAREARQLTADGIDPIEARRERQATTRAKAANEISFADAAERYIKAHAAGWKNAKHADQWRNTLKTYAYPVIGSLSVASIDTAHITKIIEPIWAEKTETASRVRGRIELVLDWAKARHYRNGENPARWRGHLDKLLPARSKVSKVRHHPAMTYTDLPSFMPRLREVSGIAARALEFTILTAVRTSEAIGATDAEFDLVEKVWTIPAERMKADKPHRVPLCDRAVEILQSTPREAHSPYVFPGAKRGKPLSNMAMLEVLRGMDGTEGLTVHGFRSTFRDWAAERSSFPREIAEAALAHTVRDKTEAAYQRGDMLEKRRRLMSAWAGFLVSAPASSQNVLPLSRKSMS
ncbi:MULTISPECIES: tyrosine-type recombinase/integrase [Brucella]|uniref:Integrase n=1 Tax=Brucella oryzae TaxID=335286 RepID=A0A2S7J3X5_9HYPH|nr:MULTISPECIES: site-specific integrase [Brucella]PQA74951.1 integrase [Brucella oryzae]